MSKFEEKTIASKRVYDGVLLKVNADRVRLPDGGESVREFVEHPGAVMVIPLLADGRVVMERQYRYPLKREFIEFPAGKIDPGEEPLATAKRELREETGYEAAEWAHLTTIHPLIAYSDERIEIFAARKLTLQSASLEAGEFLALRRGDHLALQAVALQARIDERHREHELAALGVHERVLQVGIQVQRLVGRDRPRGRGPDHRKGLADDLGQAEGRR